MATIGFMLPPNPSHTPSTAQPIRGISSMATRALLAELVAAFGARSGWAVQMESVGGVDAARRVLAGEVCDVVVVASDALHKLLDAGHLVPGSVRDLVHSGVAVAVPAGAPQPDISTEAALRQAVLDAPSVGFSTGPSGVALNALFARWGMAEALQSRLVQAPPGVPVGALVASGAVALGFQQLSELVHVPGITLLGPLPEAVQITTTFSAGVCVRATQPDAARALIRFLASSEAADAKRRQGMVPA